MHATDRDLNGNGHITYLISEVKRSDGLTTFSDLGRFGIKESDGTLYLAGTLTDLRRKQEFPQFIITVTAVDNAPDPDDRKLEFFYDIIGTIGQECMHNFKPQLM